MSLTSFLAHFDLLAEAPNAIPQLRSLILQLAVQGKLVPQDPSDEPISSLLDSIEMERARVLKTTKSLMPGSPKQGRYNLPKEWQWIRLKDYCFIIMGQSPESSSYNQEGIGLPFYQGKSDFGKMHPTPRNWCSNPIKIAEKNDILISVRAPVGPTNICTERSCIGRGLTAIRTIGQSSHQYLLYVLRAFEKMIASLGTGTTFIAISKVHLENLLIPLPPLAEQHRIVAKVEQLMALCDRLEARQQERRAARLAYGNLAIERLLEARDAEELAAGVRRLADSFDLLYDTPETVGRLRQAVLQLAVQGRLVPQDPSDEPASVLLEKIKNEKQLLASTKEIKKDYSTISDALDTLPYPLPSTWVWTRLGSVCRHVADGPHYSPKYVTKEEGIPFLSTRNVRINGFDLSSLKYVSIEDHRNFIKRTNPELGDILYTKGGTTGMASVNTLDFEFSIWVHVALLKLHQKYVYPMYIAYALNSLHCYKQSQQYTQGSSNKDLGLTRMVLITIPIPPLAEQRRIVAKVDQFMALCDELEARLKQAQADSAALLEAMVSSLLVENGAPEPAEPA